MKTCNRCGQTKPLDMYFKCSRIKDGYMGYCKMCNNKNIKENSKTLYEEVVVGNTYKNTLGEEFKVASVDGKSAYIYFNELLHGSITVQKIKQGKVYKNARTGNIRNKVHEGQKYGSLTILESVEGTYSKVRALCCCGRESVVTIGYLVNGGRSCGCLLNERGITISNFRDSMGKWNPVTHRTDCKKLPIFSLKPNDEGCHISSWTYVDNYTYNELKGCMITKSTYVLIGMGRLNSEALGVKYNYDNDAILLHCWVKAMPTGVDNLVTDHKNGCKLDNRPENLRIADSSQNGANSKAASKVGYKGVYVLKESTKGKVIKNVKAHGWIPETGKHKFLGKYYTVEEAAKAVDIWNIQVYGEFARLNLKRSIYEDMGLLPKKEKKYKLP